MFSDKVLMITGGTGSFGNAALRRFMKEPFKEIRVFSRDEKKQDDMRHEFQDPKIKFYIGNTRDRDSIDAAMRGVDYVFHAAALKQVPSCEFFPMQAVMTNIVGTANVLESAIANGVKNVICLSTDKACYPINAMGTSKAMMEKVAIAYGRQDCCTTICCTRYGNVLCSRGSVVPLWIDQIRAGKPITVTDAGMTRFMMSLEEAIDLVLFAFEHGNQGDLFVHKAPAATLDTLAKAVADLFDPGHEIRVIGTRHGEKRFESLVTREEMAKAEDMGGYYRIPCDARDLNYDKYFVHGDKKVVEFEDYNSNNTERLDVEGMKKMLLTIPYVRDRLEKSEK